MANQRKRDEKRQTIGIDRKKERESREERARGEEKERGRVMDMKILRQTERK